MTAAVEGLRELFPPSESSDAIVSVDEAALVVYHRHIQLLTRQYTDTIAYIEYSPKSNSFKPLVKS